MTGVSSTRATESAIKMAATMEGGRKKATNTPVMGTSGSRACACIARTRSSENLVAVCTIGSPLRADRPDGSRSETDQEAAAPVRLEPDPGVDERARGRRERREERSSHLVAARVHVADLRPRMIAALAQGPPPERERDLDPILEYESRARLECDHRREHEREGNEAKAAEGPQALRSRSNRSNDERDDEAEQQDRHGHRVRGDRAIRIQERSSIRAGHQPVATRPPLIRLAAGQTLLHGARYQRDAVTRDRR